MIRICKAVISVEGTAYLAVHKDGQPGRLGKEIYEAAIRGQSIAKAAAKHVIVAAVPRLVNRMNLGRLAYLAKKHKYSCEQIQLGMRRGWNLGPEDQLIISINEYGDLAEHQYDLREDGVYWRPLRGYWPESLDEAGEFRKLGWVVLEQIKKGQNCPETTRGDEM